jgi:hypothetical protein
MFVTIGALHTQYSLTQPQLSGVQLQQLLSTSISFPELIFVTNNYFFSFLLL